VLPWNSGFLVAICLGAVVLVFRVSATGGAGVVEECVELVLRRRGRHRVNTMLGGAGRVRDGGKRGGNSVRNSNEDV
jgi:hypothetical protein